MSNHYHLLIETPEGNLSQVMQHINGSYTTYYSVKRKRAGHLFQGRYSAILIDANGDGTNDVFVDANGDGINDQSGYHYDGGYQYHQGSGGNTGMPNVTWPMGQHGVGMMND